MPTMYQGVPFDTEDAMFQPPQSNRLSAYEPPTFTYQEPSPLPIDSVSPTPVPSVSPAVLCSSFLCSEICRVLSGSGNHHQIVSFHQRKTFVDFSRNARSVEEMRAFYQMRSYVQNQKTLRKLTLSRFGHSFIQRKSKVSSVLLLGIPC